MSLGLVSQLLKLKTASCPLFVFCSIPLESDCVHSKTDCCSWGLDSANHRCLCQCFAVFVVVFYGLFKMLTHTVDVSDYTSLYHLISYSYFNVLFHLLLRPPFSCVLLRLNATFVSLKRPSIKSILKIEPFVSSVLRTESPSRCKMTPLTLVRWILKPMGRRMLKINTASSV